MGNIQWDPKKFGFESLRAIFEDSKIKEICRLDNASSAALVSTIEKSRAIPTMNKIKEGFKAVLMKYGDKKRGYRMKKKGSKKTDIRTHFAQITGKALKPKVWFNKNVKISLKNVLISFGLIMIRNQMEYGCCS